MVEAVVKSIEERMDTVEEDIKHIKDSIGTIADIMSAAKTTVRVLVTLGIIFKWLGSLAIGIAAIFALITFAKTGVPPQIHLD